METFKSLKERKKNSLNLLKEMEELAKKSRAAKKRFIYHSKKLASFQMRFELLLKKMPDEDVKFYSEKIGSLLTKLQP